MDLKLSNISQAPLYGWTDSTITLAWLKQHPSTWNTYVVNCVSEIQTSLPTVRWNHISSKHNPADCASRDLSAAELASHNLWWSGPPWLQKASESWPIHEPASRIESFQITQMLAEARKSMVQCINSTKEWELLYDYSSWTRLVSHRLRAKIRP